MAFYVNYFSVKKLTEKSIKNIIKSIKSIIKLIGKQIKPSNFFGSFELFLLIIQAQIQANSVLLIVKAQIAYHFIILIYKTYKLYCLVRVVLFLNFPEFLSILKEIIIFIIEFLSKRSLFLCQIWVKFVEEQQTKHK